MTEAVEIRQKQHAEFATLIVNGADATELTKLAATRSSRFHAPKSHKDVPKVELSSENRVHVNVGRCGHSMQSKLKDTELSRAEAREALVGAGKLNAKAASAFHAERRV